MFEKLAKLFATETLDAIFPFVCLGCGREGRSMCADCLAGVPRLVPPRFCVVCAAPDVLGRCGWCRSAPVAVDGIRAPYVYSPDSLVRRALIRFKFGDVRAMAAELAGHLAECMARYNLTADAIAPVPSHPRRLRERGFNQAALLAAELGKATGLEVRESLLTRTIDAPSQLSVSGIVNRWANVAGSFACEEPADDLSLLLVDDIVTTGATMSACAGALKASGAREVWGLAVARTRFGG